MISVLMTAYNAEKTIAKAINSVIRQTFRDLELVICDDGSTDATAGIIRSIHDPRIRYYHRENGGVASARNFLLEKIRGESYIFLDSDDYFEPKALEVLNAQMVKSGSDMVVADFRVVYEDKRTEEMHGRVYEQLNMEKDPMVLLDVHPQPWNKLIKTKVMKEGFLLLFLSASSSEKHRPYSRYHRQLCAAVHFHHGRHPQERKDRP